MPQVRYNLGKKVFVIGGLGGYYTFNQVIDDRLEIRPFQGIMAKWPAIGNAALENYLRLEERVEFDTDNWNSKISLRLRLRLMFIYKFNAMEESRYWRILAGLEGFAGAGPLEPRAFPPFTEREEVAYRAFSSA